MAREHASDVHLDDGHDGPMSVNEQLTALGPQHQPGAVENQAYLAMLRRMLRSYRNRVAAGDIEDLAEMLALRSYFDELIGQAVEELREQQSYSWTDIGRAEGLTRQAAQQKYRRRG